MVRMVGAARGANARGHRDRGRLTLLFFRVEEAVKIIQNLTHPFGDVIENVVFWTAHGLFLSSQAAARSWQTVVQTKTPASVHDEGVDFYRG